jgi:hypothetical protein
MKLRNLLGRPPWLSSNAETRREAVASERHPELEAALGRIAREDPDASVRLAALRRLADPGIAQGMAHDDADPALRAQARSLWLDLLTGVHPSAPALSERLRLLQAQDAPELIEYVARRAPDAELRLAALARCTRQPLLVERAIEDADPAIRSSLVEHIDDEAALLRIAERARKTDKQLGRRARERIESLRLLRGDPAERERQARLLCAQIEGLLRDPAGSDVEAALAARWAALGDGIPDTLCQRFSTAQRLLAESRERALRGDAPAAPAATAAEVGTAPPASTTDRPNDGVAPSPEATGVAEALPPSAPADSDAPATAGDGAAQGSDEGTEAIVAPLLAQARFAASVGEAAASKEAARERQQALLAEAAPLVEAFAAAVDAGATAQAQAARQRLDAVRERLAGPLPGALARRLADAEPDYARLQHWQNWAGSQHRRGLCETVERLAGSGLHPDAIATAVREAQDEWNRLAPGDGVQAGRDGLERRFHAACRAALAPAQAYFRKRQELRASQAQEITTLLERVQAGTGEGASRADLATGRRELAQGLRALDKVDPRERKQLAQRLRERLAQLDERIGAHDRAIEEARAALIGEAEALVQAEPLPRGLAGSARELQQRWQQLGTGRRARDQAQWNAFRRALDAAFARLDQARGDRRAQDAAAVARADELLAELESLSAQEAPDRAAEARLQSEWTALGVAEPARIRRHDAAVARLREAGERAAKARRHARFHAWQARYALCRAAEAQARPAEVLREDWRAAPTTDIAATVLQARFDAALGEDADSTTAGDSGAARDLLLELEALAGIESPAADRDRRRELQVARLAARLRGDAPASPADELAMLLERWSASGPAPADSDGRLQQALQAALATLP